MTPQVQNFFTPQGMPHLEIRTTLDSVSAYAPHFHNTFSIGIILKGKTSFNSCNTNCLAKANDIILIEPEMVHSCNPVNGTARSYHMLYLDKQWCLKQINPNYAAELTNEITICAQQPQISNLLLGKLFIKTIAGVCQENVKPTVQLNQLLQNLLKKHCSIVPAQLAKKQQTKIHKAASEFLNKKFEHHVKVKDIAATAELCRESFTRTFHKLTGLPPAKYHTCVRLEQARELLRAGVSIVDTALATGYVDQSHFHRTFVKYYAATPNQYRQMHNSKSLLSNK